MSTEEQVAAAHRNISPETRMCWDAADYACLQKDRNPFYKLDRFELLGLTAGVVEECSGIESYAED